MPNHSKSVKFRLILIFSWVLVIGLIPLVTVKWWLPGLTSKLIPDSIDSLDFKVDSISLNQFTVQDLEVEVDNLKAKMPDVIIRTALQSLFKGELESILINKPELEYRIKNSQTEISDKRSEEPEKVDFQELIYTKPPVIPFKELLIDDLQINLTNSQKDSLLLQSDLSLSQKKEISAVYSSTQFGDNSVTFNLEINEADQKRSFDGLFELSSPLKSINKVTKLFNNKELIDLKTLQLRCGKLVGNLEWDSEDEAIQLQAMLDSFSLKNNLTANTTFLHIESSDDLQTMSGLFSVQKIQFSDYLNATISGSIQGNGLRTGSPEFAASVNALTHPLKVGDKTYSISPINIKADYQNEELRLSSHFISIDELPVSLESIQCLIQTNENTTGIELSSEIGISSEQISVEPQATDKINFHADIQQSHESFATSTQISIPPSLVRMKDYFGLNMSGLTEGNFQLSGNNESAKFHANLKLAEIEVSANDQWSLNGSSTINAELELYDWLKISADNFHTHINPNKVDATLETEVHWLENILKIQSLTMQTKDVTLLKDGFNISALLDAEKIQFNEIPIHNIQSRIELSPQQVIAKISANLVNDTLHLNGDISHKLNPANTNGRLSVRTAHGLETSSINLKSILPDFQNAIVSGLLDALVEITTHQETANYSFMASLRNGAFTLPNSGIALMGIEFPHLEIKDLITGVGNGKQTIKIESIDIPPTHLNHLELSFSLLKNYSVMIESCKFQFCDGWIEITTDSPVAAPYHSLDMVIKFHGLDLEKLTSLIPDFKEELTGKIEGYIPFSFVNGNISWKKGRVSLVKGTTGTLKYAKEGLISQYIPEISISKDLNMNIDDAIRDTTLTQLEIEIQNSNEFDKPSIIVMSGHSNNPKIQIPIEKIQLNIRAGDLPSLINRSFNLPQWIDSIILAK